MRLIRRRLRRILLVYIVGKSRVYLYHNTSSHCQKHQSRMPSARVVYCLRHETKQPTTYNYSFLRTLYRKLRKLIRDEWCMEMSYHRPQIQKNKKKDCLGH